MTNDPTKPAPTKPAVESNSPSAKAVQYGPGFSATFLYYFSSTAIVFSLVTAKALHLSPVSSFPQQMGLLGGIVGGLVGAYFNRTVTMSVPVKQEKAFLKTLNQTLAQLGFELVDQEEEVRIYQRSGLRRFLSGKIYVQIEPSSATIASRATQIRLLKKVLE